jgi:hypothetical protein
MSDNSISHSGRSTWLVLGALAIFGVVWWFLPTPQVADSQPPFAAVAANTPLQATPAELVTPAVSTVAAASESTVSQTTASETAASPSLAMRILGPSKGSLLANPKPRELVSDRTQYAKLESIERHLTARSIEEAEWMDLQSFPTLEEVNLIDPESLEKYYHKPNVNIRALVLQAVIWKRQDDPRWRNPALLSCAFGSILGHRLVIDDEMAQGFSVSRDKRAINLVLVGKMLGDNYTPYEALINRDRGRWPTLKVMTNSELAFAAFQINIPKARARAGLPPLQVLRIPVAGRQ